MIYVMSDIHGNEKRFDSILRQIRLQPEDTLYVLGDVVDRHPGGVRILRRLMAMPNAQMILGNHEYMMLRALGLPYDKAEPTDPETLKKATEHWYRNGGKVTHFRWKCTRKTLRAQIVEYLHHLPLNIDIEVNGTRYKLVHGAPASEFVPEQRYPREAYFAVWKRWNPEDPLPGDYTMIFGHTPTIYFQEETPMQLWYGEHRIGIDCGSGYSDPRGRLACLRLDDGAVFYSEEP